MTAATILAPPAVDFTAHHLLSWLEVATPKDLDALAFGVIGMASDGSVERYNAAEAKLSGLSQARVMGRNFFTSVAPCTNNFMVAHRFAAASDFDAVIDFVFTFRMAPIKVHLRLLKHRSAALMYLVVRKRE